MQNNIKKTEPIGSVFLISSCRVSLCEEHHLCVSGHCKAFRTQFAFRLRIVQYYLLFDKSNVDKPCSAVLRIN